MDQEMLSWLDESFLASVLQGGGVQEECLVSILKFSVKPAVAVGNNYTSHIYRILVDYTRGQSDKVESISLIAKIPIQKGLLHDLSDTLDFFSKEPKMYNDLLPKMCEKSKLEFGPKSFYCPLKGGMVVQDLKPEGYLLFDKFQQLDFEHCKLVIEKLGRFHATSVSCYHDDHGLIETLGKETTYSRETVDKKMKSWVEATMRLFAAILEQNEHEKEIIDLVLNKTDTIWDSVVNICNPKSNTFNVLNHGDCWSSNMLFKYSDSGDVVDVMLIDFQLLRFASPVSDIIYFIWTSANEEVRENNLQDLYNIYLQTLNKTLEELGCHERMTGEEFHEDLKSASDYILLIIACVLPWTKCETEDAIDMENFTSHDFENCDKDERFLKMFSGKHYRALLPSMVKQYLSIVSS